MAETMNATQAAPAENKSFPWVKLIVAVLVIGGLIALFKFLPVKDWIEQFKSYVQEKGPLGYVLFGLVYVGVSLIPGGPAALLTLAAGAIWGLVTGTIVVSISSVTAATIAFLLARTVFRQRVEKMTSGNVKFQGLNRAIGKQGAKIVALVRLSPVFPFTFINYAFPLTPVKLLTYVLASWIAMLPGTMAYVYFGAAVGAVAGNATSTQKAIKISLGVAAVIATIIIARIAAKAIKTAGVDESAGAVPPPGA